jgi:hypothetical protein
LADNIDFHDSEASCDQFPQPLLYLDDEMWIAPNHLSGLVVQPSVVVAYPTLLRFHHLTDATSVK